MRILSGLLAVFFLVCPVSAQQFIDRTDLLNEQNGNKHFAWSVSIADLDGNGLPDIHEPGILYLQQEDGTFVSSLPQLGITYRQLPPPIVGYEGRGVFGSVMADIDNDGFNDFVILDIIEDSSKVFSNHFGLYLTEESPANGIDFEGLGQGAAFADFNGDGALDLFFGEEHGHNQLFLGNGRGSFTESSEHAHIHVDVHTYGVAAFDFDNDGDMDVFIAACAQDPDHSVNALLRNNGDGTFEEVGAAAGINDDGNAWGVNFFDYDRDGWLDIHIANMRYNFFDTRGNANKLYRNKGDGTFEDVTVAAGMEGNDDSYGSSVADFNNDGWPDVWVANFGSPPAIMMNNGDGTFTDAFTSSGLSDIFANLSVGVADLNADGWVDVYSGSDDLSGPGSRLLLNSPGSNNWLTLKLIQEAPNRRGIGARIAVWSEGNRQITDIVAGDGFVSQNLDLSAHFGLGTTAVVDSVIVRWPDGHRDHWTGLAANQQLTLEKGGTFNEPPLSFRAETIVTKRSGSRIEADVSWEATTDPEGETISYTVAVRDSSGQIVHVSDPLLETNYSFDLDTTGVGLAIPLTFAVAASDGMHVLRSVNTGTVFLEGTNREVHTGIPRSINVEALWPLPAHSRVSVAMESDLPTEATWRLVNGIGQTVEQGRWQVRTGPQVETLETGHLSAGWYMLLIQTEKGRVQRPLVITR